MKIRGSVLDTMIAHAEGAYPGECCGILLAGGADPSTVAAVVRAENVEDGDRERGYVLGHKAHLEAVKMESTGEFSIIGYYHSHPDGTTRPSRRDAKQAVGETLYMILGISDGGAGQAAWQLEGDEFVEISLNVVE